jgi:hypothetical protein
MNYKENVGFVPRGLYEAAVVVVPGAGVKEQ